MRISPPRVPNTASVCILVRNESDPKPNRVSAAFPLIICTVDHSSFGIKSTRFTGWTAVFGLTSKISVLSLILVFFLLCCLHFGLILL